MPFHLESLWGATLMTIRVYGKLGRNKIVRVGIKSGPVLSRLWTKVHEILGQYRRHFLLSSALASCLYHVSFRRYDDDDDDDDDDEIAYFTVC